MPTCIQYLPIGTWFRLACDPQVRGTLTGLSECSAAVRLHGASSDVLTDLLNNPFDEDLKSITEPFGVLLRDIVTTIDQYGLYRRYLKKHDVSVDQFFKVLATRGLRSDVAEGLRHRLQKYGDKLFTFIKYNGVPWNNNNAENAIKRFAYYGEDTVGVMKESGLKDYLVLLSLCHTCRYRGMSFLKFLLSRERDVNKFNDRARARRRPSVVELYPKGFIPPHLTGVKRKQVLKADVSLPAREDGHERAQ